MIYLDNAATTRPYPEVIHQIDDCLRHTFANPSSVHPAGVSAGRLISEARGILARIFQIPLPGVIFTGSGTESDNLAIKGVLWKEDRYDGELITTHLEHAAILNTVTWLEKAGVIVHYVQLDPQTGQVDLEHLKNLVNPKTKIISVQHVNSETGVLQDLTQISKTAKAVNPKVLIHSDGVQAFTKIPVKLKPLGVDLYSISGHKFGGIKGAGALLMSSKIALETMLHGGGQENGIRSGTENVAGIIAMATAAQISCEKMDQNYDAIESFSTWLKTALKNRFPLINIFQAENTLPHIINLSFPGVLGEVLLHHLAEREIYVSTGSACNASGKKLSATLQATGFSAQRIKETVRISLAAGEIPEDRESFLETFCRRVEDLMAMH